MIRKENRRVLTAIEIFIAIIIIIALVVAVRKAYFNASEKGSEAALDSDIANVCKTLNLYNTSAQERITSLTDKIPELKLSIEKGDPFDSEYVIEVNEKRWRELVELIEFNGSYWAKKK